MTVAVQSTAIGVFENRYQARRAIRQLQQAGFADEDLGFAARTDAATDERKKKTGTGHPSADGAATGAVMGGMIGLGAGLAVTAGLMPALGPMVVGGTLISLLASVATGAVAG